jgi:hypothetical protein
MVALNVTVWPAVEGLGNAARVVLLEVLAGLFTVSVNGAADALALVLPSPL